MKLFKNIPTALDQIQIDYKHPQMSFPDTHQRMELDIFLCNLSLAFEYQGEHHFMSIERFGDAKDFKARDEFKRQACLREGITLIEVPYWWDYSADSLRATIHQYRPDIFHGMVLLMVGD